MILHQLPLDAANCQSSGPSFHSRIAFNHQVVIQLIAKADRLEQISDLIDWGHLLTNESIFFNV